MISVNQNRQFYVVTGINPNLDANTTATPGLTKVVDKKNYFYIQQFNATGELVRSDLVYKKNIIAVKKSLPIKTQNKLKQAKVVLQGNPKVGEDYILTILIRNFTGAGTDTTYIKTIPLHVTSAITDATKFNQEFAKVATKSFSREATKPFTFTCSANGLLITETEGDWILGVEHETPLTFEVYCDEVDGETWGKVQYSGSMTYTDGSEAASALASLSRSTLNSKMVADLEWFCKGEIGDQYRNVCWPKVIPTKYMVNPESTNGYVTYDIHYAYIGDGMENQASEKTLTLAVEAGATAVITALDGYLENGLGSLADGVTNTTDPSVGDDQAYFDLDPDTEAVTTPAP